MDILLLCEPRILADKIPVAVFDNILGQALQALLLHHALNDLPDKCRQPLERLGQKLGIAVNILKPVHIRILPPLLLISQNIIDIVNIAGKFLPVRFAKLL